MSREAPKRASDKRPENFEEGGQQAASPRVRRRWTRPTHASSVCRVLAPQLTAAAAEDAEQRVAVMRSDSPDAQDEVLGRKLRVVVGTSHQSQLAGEAQQNMFHTSRRACAPVFGA